MGGFVTGAGVGPVTLVSRDHDLLDAFAVGLDGGVYTAAWQPGGSGWRGWWRIDGVEVAPCASVGAVSRAPGRLDLFVVGLDGGVSTAAWDPGAGWRGWWRVGGLKTTLMSPVAAVSRSANKLDIFCADLDGRVCTAAWEPGDDTWRGWWQIGELQVPPGAPVDAVSRSTDKLDIFAVGSEGHVHTAAWEPGKGTWQGWWQIPGLDALPRSPVGAVSRAKDKLDVFVTRNDGRICTAAWQPGDTTWRGWWTVGDLVAAPRTPVTAVCRRANALDIFATGQDGRVRTAAWQPGDTTWRGWWTVGSLATDPATPLAAVSRSKDLLDVAAPGSDGRVYTAAWKPGDSAWRGWWTIIDLVTGMTDPRVGDWTKVGVAMSVENTVDSEEAQGVTTDGNAWFLSSNNSNRIRKYGNGSSLPLLAQLDVAQGNQGGHVGAPGCFEGWIYVPIQHPYGVWKATVDLTSPSFHAAEQGTDRFPWCDVNPLNGRLYTSEFDHWNNTNGVLFAYDRTTLQRCPEDDIALGSTPIHFDRIQGGVFTRRGRLILSRSGPNGIFCFSARTGHCFGGKHLGNFGSTGSEVEGVTVRSWQFSGIPAHVHVLELDNDFWNKDDCYLHSYRVPEPDRL